MKPTYPFCHPRLLAVLVTIFAVVSPVTVTVAEDRDRSDAALRDEPILPIPLQQDLDKQKVLLGEALFHDPRLSKDNTISCAHCHNLGNAGVDGLQQSIGINDARGAVNAPTVFNSGFNLAQFWDGRARDLEEQAAGPVHNPVEMGTDWDEVIPKLKGDKAFARTFRRVYPDGLSGKNIVDAIAIYERSLTTPNSPFDRYLRGDDSALSAEALQGYQLFKSYGCISCHQGVNVGGNMFQVLGTMGDYFAERGDVSDADFGRYNVTSDEFDKFSFKVPSLRLVTRTAPYFHDGRVNSLELAIDLMARYQLGRTISSHDTKLIIEFMKSLEGEYRRVEP